MIQTQTYACMFHAGSIKYDLRYVHICIERLELKILWLYINHKVEQILTNKIIERIYELVTIEHANVWL